MIRNNGEKTQEVKMLNVSWGWGQCAGTSAFDEHTHKIGFDKCDIMRRQINRPNQSINDESTTVFRILAIILYMPILIIVIHPEISKKSRKARR